MRKLQNEEGIALLTALMFTLITLGMVMALLEMLLVETKQSGSERSYRNSLEASYGGTELITKDIIPRLANYSSGIGSVMFDYGGTGVGKIELQVNSTNNALQTKLTTATASWGPTLSKTPNPSDTPDISFKLKGQNSNTNYQVYAKIVDTVPGNSDMTGVDYLESGMGVAGNGAGIAPKHNPTLYTIEVQGQRATNAKEKALLSVLYAY